MDAPPPPPPPHGATPGGSRSGGLPDGKYDIFVIPPSSAGSGFLYLPSLQTQRNSFIAGVACTAAVFFIYSVAIPVIKQWFTEILRGSGSGVILLMVAIGVVSWAWGKTQAEGTTGGGSTGSGRSTGAGAPPGAQGAQGFNNRGPFPGSHFAPEAGANGPGSPGGTKPSWQRTKPQGTPGSSAKTSWEKAREESRKKEEERRKTEELKKRREELEKERQKLREKEARERIIRDAKARAEAAAKAEATVKTETVAKAEAAARAKAAEEKLKSSPKRPPMPSARTEQDDDAYSFRPYDRPKHKANSAASVISESSYAPSQTTARTTPPPSQRGPYSTKDPDKIIIKAVYSFNNAFMKTPISQLISGKGTVTDGLILRITTEGLFIDDDVRGVPQREWDIKAWTMKLAESCEMMGLHVLRASIRDQEGKKYVFVISQSEGWKVAVGLQRLRGGTQVRALGVAGLPQNEAKTLIQNLGWA